MTGLIDAVADHALCVVEPEGQPLSASVINAVLCDTDLVDDAHCLFIDDALPQLGVVVVPSAKGWALVDARSRLAYTETLGDLLAAHCGTSVLPQHWRLLWALPQGEQGSISCAAARALFDPRRPDARLLDRQGDCLTFAVEIDPALPYFEGHFERVAVLAGVVQVEWAVRFGRELFGIGDDFLRMEALKFQKVVRPGDAVQMVLDWNAERATLTFGFTSQAGKHSSGRIVFGARS